MTSITPSDSRDKSQRTENSTYRCPTAYQRRWSLCPRILGRRHLPSKRVWNVFCDILKMLMSFLRRTMQCIVNFGTWIINQSALRQLKSLQTKTSKTKTACWQNGVSKKIGTKTSGSRTSGRVAILRPRSSESDK